MAGAEGGGAGVATDCWRAVDATSARPLRPVSGACGAEDEGVGRLLRLLLLPFAAALALTAPLAAAPPDEASAVDPAFFSSWLSSSLILATDSWPSPWSF